MKPITKKMSEWFLGCVLIVTAVLVWWVHVYAPLQERSDVLTAEIYKESQEQDRLAQRFKKFSDAKTDPGKIKDKVEQFNNLVVKGKSLEEVSVHTQLWVQEFMETHALALAAYKGLSPSRWRDYPLSLVGFQLNAATQGLSDLLESLENMEQAVRIEKLEVNYSRNMEYDLGITLHLGSLFVEGLRK